MQERVQLDYDTWERQRWELRVRSRMDRDSAVLRPPQAQPVAPGERGDVVFPPESRRGNYGAAG